MQDRIHVAVHEDVIGHVVEHEPELPVPGQVGDVVGRARQQVVHRDDAVALGEQPVAAGAIPRTRLHRSQAPASACRLQHESADCTAAALRLS